MNTNIPVPMTNEKERQTYDGAINMTTKDVHVCPFPKGDRVQTVKFVKHLQALYPRAKLLLIWDGVSDHQYADLQAYLQYVNKGLQKKDWKVTCDLFAPNAPDQHPVEDK